jgi:hypothetical protein
MNKDYANHRLERDAALLASLKWSKNKTGAEMALPCCVSKTKLAPIKYLYEFPLSFNLVFSILVIICRLDWRC